MFDAHIVHSGSDRVIVTTEQAQIYSFRNVNGGFQLEWPRGGGVPAATLAAENVGWTLREPNARLTRYYDSFGLRKIRSLDDGRTITITYDEDGKPSAVTNSWAAWSWDVATNASGRITAITVVDHPELGWQYTYDGNDLTSVTSVANVPWRTYTYGPLLTAVHDALGNLIESHTFDGDQAVSDTSSGPEISGVTYDHAGRTADEEYTETTAGSGAVTRYYSRLVAGMRRVVELAGSCDCGSEDIVYARGPQGEVLREQDARGYVTEYTYGPDATVLLLRRWPCARVTAIRRTIHRTVV
jgi:YD repeat-containing protein